MAEHEPCIGASDDWYTPPEIFDAINLTFDLDPCSPGASHWVPARRVFTINDDGLKLPWKGSVWMNPPFGGRNGHVPWLTRFLDHANGIAVVRAYTSSSWFHEHVWPRAETVLFPKGKTKFIPSPELRRTLEGKSKDGTFHNAPGHGIALIAMGEQANRALRRSGLGFWVTTTSIEPPTPEAHGNQPKQGLASMPTLTGGGE